MSSLAEKEERLHKMKLEVRELEREIEKIKAESAAQVALEKYGLSVGDKILVHRRVGWDLKDEEHLFRIMGFIQYPVTGGITAEVTRLRKKDEKPMSGYYGRHVKLVEDEFRKVD